jgi:hypothetical protein
VGFKVLKLVRTGIGPLTLAGLEVGKWRELTPQEIAALRKPSLQLRIDTGQSAHYAERLHFSAEQ